MKFLLLALVVVVVVVAKNHGHNYNNSAHFAHWLSQVQKSPEFQTMSSADQNAYNQLIKEAEKGPDALNKAIDNMTFVKFLKMINGLEENDIIHLEKYFAAHMENIAAGTNPAKRNNGHGHNHGLSNTLHELHTVHKISEHLNHADKAMFIQLLEAVYKNELTQFLDQGDHYSLIFTLLADMDKDRTLNFDKLIEAHLEMEAAMAATA